MTTIVKVNEGELLFMMYKTGRSGEFYTNLFNAIQSADTINKRRLAVSYPEEIAAFRNYQDVSGYWEALQERYYIQYQQ